MDAKAQKALFRAKLKEAAQKREKRIDSPLVRYNEYDQPVCRVCDVALKSDSLWPAHQASRKHVEAIKNFKAAATGLTRGNDAKEEPPVADLLNKPRSSSSLPANFFDEQDRKKPKTSQTAASKVVPVVPSTTVKPVDPPVVSHVKQVSDLVQEFKEPPRPFVLEPKGSNENRSLDQLSNPSRKTNVSEVKQGNGVLPAGFFDNKEADLRARGIEIVKPDIRDEYKEFEKAIEEDVQGVDERLEEEEFDAADMIEEAELLEQKAYKERVEMLKAKQMESKAAKFAGGKKKPLKFRGEESSGESSSDEDDDEENSTVDWRAKHL